MTNLLRQGIVGSEYAVLGGYINDRNTSISYMISVIFNHHHNQSSIKSYFIIADSTVSALVAREVLPPAALCLTALFALMVFVTLWNAAKLPERWLSDWQFPPHFGPTRQVPEASSGMTAFCVLVHWITTSAVIAAGIALAAAGALWALGLYPTTWPTWLLTPYLIFEAMIDAWGLAGTIIARATVLICCLPGLLWAAMWCLSLVLAAWEGLALFLGSHVAVLPASELGRPYGRGGYENIGPSAEDRIASQLARLCSEVDMRPPVVVIDHGITECSSRMFLPAPRIAAIHVSAPLAAVLNRDELDVLLAHELAHLKLHAKVLWFVQLACCLTCLPPGFLTLLLDYRRMELEADEWAARATWQRPDRSVIPVLIRVPEFTRLLERLPALTAQAQVAMWSACGDVQRPVAALPERYARAKQALGRALRTWPLAAETRALYEFYFGSGIWGYFHPSPEDRMRNLQRWQETHTRLWYLPFVQDARLGGRRER